MNSNLNHGNSRKEKLMIAFTKTTLVAMLVTLGLALVAPVRAAETELIGAQTPWRVFLRMGPYVGRKDGAFLAPGGIGGREAVPVDFTKAEFLKLSLIHI